MQSLDTLRRLTIPIIHGTLTIFHIISSNDRIPWDGLKQGLSFLGLVLYLFLCLKASIAMNLYPSDISDVHTLASFVWFVIEQLVFISLIVSNMLFLGIRSCFTHKLRLSAIDEKRQLPTVDTLIAISELANAFNAQFTPWFVNNYLNLTNLNQDDGTGDIGPQL